MSRKFNPSKYVKIFAENGIDVVRKISVAQAENLLERDKLLPVRDGAEEVKGYQFATRMLARSPISTSLAFR